jgi:hypothetical protein
VPATAGGDRRSSVADRRRLERRAEAEGTQDQA